jgi:GT2 family glycosyltransferase
MDGEGMEGIRTRPLTSGRLGRMLEGRGGLTSVITVNFNAGAHLVATARSVLSSTAPVEWLCVDNGSTDSSLEELRRAVGEDPKVRVLENGTNLGFSRANNRAIRESRGDWVLLLNPDCRVEPDTIERMRATVVRFPRVAVAGCLVQNPDGTEQAGCRRETPTPSKALVRAMGLGRVARRLDRDGLGFRDFVRQGDPLPESPVEVDAVSGAFMLVSRTAMESVGLLDEGYFLHCEDLDWCERFRRAGYQVLFVPDVTVVHDKGVSSRSRPVRVLWHMHRGMVRYYGKFFRGQYPAGLLGLVTLAVWLRFALLASRAVVRRTAARVFGG